LARQQHSGLPLAVVDFLDTSVFVEILDVPHMNGHRDAVVAEMDARLKANVKFVLPTATVMKPETTSSRSREAPPVAVAPSGS
jgi:hypothetical protein